MNVALTGFMGTGKTSVGIELARILAWEFIDTDKVIEKNLDMEIPKIFKELGEAAFRSEEQKVVQEVCSFKEKVISTGGGVILNQDNVQNLEKSSLIVCLQCTPDIIFERIKKDNNRPLLAGEVSIEYIAQMMEKRAPYYQCAHIHIDTSKLTVAEAVEIILIELRKRGMVHGNNKKS